MRALIAAILFAASAFAQAPTITSFTTSAATVTPGGSATLTWAVSGATSISISPGITGTLASPFSTASASGSQSFAVPATANVTFVGDSHVCGLRATNAPCAFGPDGSPCCSYPSILSRRAATTGQVFTWTNQGVSGGRALTQTPIACDAATHQPAVHSIGLGSNDLANATTAAAVIANLTGRWDTLIAAGCKVVAWTILPRSTISAAVQLDITDKITTAAATRGIPVVDVTADSRIGCQGCNNDTTYYNADAQHPNDAGYRIMGELGKAAILSQLPVTYTLTATNGSGSTTATVNVSVVSSNATAKSAARNVFGRGAVRR